MLDNLDKVQRYFLREVGLTANEALKDFNLAPLCSRRDMALLGLVHRTVLKQGPEHFQKWFFPTARLRHQHRTRLQEGLHNKQLHDWLDGEHTELLRRSPLGLARVYNHLPQEVVDSPSVSCFQSALQENLRDAANAKAENWEFLYSPRKKK